MSNKEIIVPQLGESVSEATIASWNKKVGDQVQVDDLLVELETDKVTLEVNAPASGILKKIEVAEDETVTVGAVLGIIEEGAVSSNKSSEEKKSDIKVETEQKLSPAPRKMVADNNIDTSNIQGTGKDNRITKGDIINSLTGQPNDSNHKPTEIVKMSKLRQKIAQRLKDSQNTAAILSTFNEIDMTEVMSLRNRYKDKFQEKYGVKLGFMSFFVKAVVSALQEIPTINAEIEGNNIIYKNFYDIGVAVGTKQGLVVPVVRNADKLSIADIETNIYNLAVKARDGKLSVEDLTGGTFTISNGGVYGSLLSTPIINPPQSGILGMHKTQERPVVVNGEIKIRPMMYLALSYDHRIIDGKEAVTFLVKVKEALEDPSRMLLDI